MGGWAPGQVFRKSVADKDQEPALVVRKCRLPLRHRGAEIPKEK